MYLIESSGIDPYVEKVRKYEGNVVFKLAPDGTQEAHLSFSGKRKFDDRMLNDIIDERIVAINLCNTSVTDEGVMLLIKCAGVREINLSNTGINGRCIEVLTRIPDLHSLNLSGTRVTDKSILLFRNSRISYLNLSFTNITDISGNGIVNLKSLEKLFLSNTRINGEMIRGLSGLRKLRVLCLDHTMITDDSLSTIGNMLCLMQLTIRGTRIGDKGMSFIAESNTLSIVRADETLVTDQVIHAITAMKKLQLLTLVDTKVTEKAMIDLQLKMPRTAILYRTR